MGPGVIRSVARMLTSSEAREFETVFFDVHSGARYLVSKGEIVKPLQSVETSRGGWKWRRVRTPCFEVLLLWGGRELDRCGIT